MEYSGLCHGTEKRRKNILTITDSGQKEGGKASTGTKCLFCTKIEEEETGRIVISFL